MPEDRHDSKKLTTIDFKGVEIFSVGTFNGDKYELKDLEEMIEAMPKAGFKPTVKAGHPDGQEDEKVARRIFGAPALGYVERIYLKGKKLIADLVEVPKRFGELIKAGAYRRISAEIYWNYTDDATGKKFPRLLKAISFLGADIPALTNLKEIEALFNKNDVGALSAYEDGHEYRLYEMDKEYFGEIAGDSLSGYLTRFPRKTKEDADYELVADSTISDPEAEICSNCRFFLGFENACVLVEGFIEPNFTSKFFEPRLKVFSVDPDDGSENYAEDPKTYIIRKIGDEFCLIAKGTGKKLGCHPTREKAIAQEREIKANTSNELEPQTYITLQESKKGILFTMGKLKGESSLTLQTVLFDKKRWTVARAKKWLSDNDMKSGSVDEPESGSSIRFRQRTPSDFQPGSFRNIEPGARKQSENPEGGTEMTKEELDIELKGQMEKVKAEMAKEYEYRIHKAREDGKAEAESANDELRDEVRKLQSEKRSERIENWIKKLKSDGKLLPVEESKVRALRDWMPDSEAGLKYFTLKDGKTKEHTASPSDILESLFDNRPSIYRELSKGTAADEFEQTSPLDDPGEEVDRQARHYQEHQTASGNKVDYSAAVRHVLSTDPGLAQRYNQMQMH